MVRLPHVGAPIHRCVVSGWGHSASRSGTSIFRKAPPPLRLGWRYIATALIGSAMDFPVFPRDPQGHANERDSGYAYSPEVGWRLLAPATLHSQIAIICNSLGLTWFTIFLSAVLSLGAEDRRLCLSFQQFCFRHHMRRPRPLRIGVCFGHF